MGIFRDGVHAEGERKEAVEYSVPPTPRPLTKTL